MHPEDFVKKTLLSYQVVRFPVSVLATCNRSMALDALVNTRLSDTNA